MQATTSESSKNPVIKKESGGRMELIISEPQNNRPLKETSIKLSKELHNQLLLYCVLKGIKQKDALREAIQKYIENDAVTYALMQQLKKTN